jgi:hypothetical protein
MRGLSAPLAPQPQFIDLLLQKFATISANVTQPPELYRYRSCNSSFFAEELERMLLRNEFYFPSQVQLNDPFDCQPIFSKGASWADFQKYIHPVICAIRTEMSREQSQFPWTPDQVCAMVERNILLESAEDLRTVYDVKLPHMISAMFASIGVLSLTADKNNLVLWSTYANRGNGICIALRNLLLSSSGGYDVAPVGVRYVDARPEFNYWGAAALFLHMTCHAAQYVPVKCQRPLLQATGQLGYAWTKHQRWQYKDEYRMIMYKTAGEYFNIAPAEVAAIYVGNNVSRETLQAILSIADRRPSPISIYTSKMSDSSYAMAFSKVI